ncbi:MAG TPA: GNVR domain-containing protein [Terriglobales bacterium]
MESLRQNVAVQDLDRVTEIEFPSRSGPEAESPESSPDILGILQLLWNKRQIFYRVMRWALPVSVVIAFSIPTRYESSVRLMPPDSMSNTGGMLAALAGKGSPEITALAGSLLGMKGSGALYVDLFRSRTVQESVIDRLNLQKVYWARYKEDARKKLNSRTNVGEDRKSGIITLSVEDGNPQRARDIAQSYVEELNRIVSQVSTSSARRERIFIEQRLESVKNDLEDAEKQFSAFASKNTALDIKEQTRAMVTSAAELQGQLIAAQSQLQSLEQIYTPNNVRVRALRAQIEELKRQLQNLHGTDPSIVDDASHQDQMYPSIRKLPLLGVEWADLYRRMKIQETVYELLNQQYELARIQEAKEIPTINVVDPANVPEKKSWPPRMVIILLITVLSVIGTAAIILASNKIELLEHDDPRRQLAISASAQLSRIRDRVATHRFLRWFDRSRSTSDDGARG